MFSYSIFSLKCEICIKMRKIIFRIDMTFLRHKSKEITSRREYYFLAQIQEITIFPIHVYILIPNIFLSFLFFPHVMALPFIPHIISLQSLLPNPKQISTLLLWNTGRPQCQRWFEEWLILLPLCLILQQTFQVLFELGIIYLIIYVLPGCADNSCQ